MDVVARLVIFQVRAEVGDQQHEAPVLVAFEQRGDAVKGKVFQLAGQILTFAPDPFAGHLEVAKVTEGSFLEQVDDLHQILLAVVSL